MGLHDIWDFGNYYWLFARGFIYTADILSPLKSIHIISKRTYTRKQNFISLCTCLCGLHDINILHRTMHQCMVGNYVNGLCESKCESTEVLFASFFNSTYTLFVITSRAVMSNVPNIVMSPNDKNKFTFTPCIFTQTTLKYLDDTVITYNTNIPTNITEYNLCFSDIIIIYCGLNRKLSYLPPSFI